jgi:hypothetical protein
VQFEIDAPSNDVLAMNLTIAAVDRWLENSNASTGQEVGREIGAMYREIHAVLDEISPPDDEDEDDDEDDDGPAVKRALAVAG